MAKSASAPRLRLTAPLPSELQEQITVVDWWRWWAPTQKLDRRLLFSIPNGAYLAGDAIQRARQMAKLKASGCVPGVPDLFLALPAQGYAGMYVEMKKIGGRLNLEQCEMLGLLESAGYQCIVAMGADDAISAIKGYVQSKGGRDDT